ncbi:MAG: thermonuclease family protein [Phycisphaerae bacterium]
MADKPKRTAYAMSRKKRNLIFISAFILFAVISACDRISNRKNVPAISSEYQSSDISDLKKYHGQKFTVINVVDGDTIDIDSPDGKQNRTRIRLLGIDTPEIARASKESMHFGAEAKQFVIDVAEKKMVTVYLDEDQNSRDKYGRLLAYIQLEDRSSLNELLLTEGYAYAYLPFKHSFYYKYIELEAAARAVGKGLWKDVTFEQLPEWLQRRKPKLLKN